MDLKIVYCFRKLELISVFILIFNYFCIANKNINHEKIC